MIENIPEVHNRGSLGAWIAADKLDHAGHTAAVEEWVREQQDGAGIDLQAAVTYVRDYLGYLGDERTRGHLLAEWDSISTLWSELTRLAAQAPGIAELGNLSL